MFFNPLELTDRQTASATHIDLEAYLTFFITGSGLVVRKYKQLLNSLYFRYSLYARGSLNHLRNTVKGSLTPCALYIIIQYPYMSFYIMYYSTVTMHTTGRQYGFLICRKQHYKQKEL